MTRLLAAALAGIATTLAHLAKPQAVMQSIEVSNQCPYPGCGQSLDLGPHFHDSDVVWPTEHDGCVLLTGLDGSDPCVMHRSHL